MIPFQWHGQHYFVQQLHGVQDVLEASGLLFEGWKVLCDRKGARAEIEWDDFLQKVLQVTCGPYNGATFVFFSKNKKPLGFIVLAEDTESRSYPTVFIYAGYSLGKDLNAGKMAMEFVCKWAKVNSFREVRAQSRRISGSAMRYFRKLLGFETLSVVFRKVVQ